MKNQSSIYLRISTAEVSLAASFVPGKRFGMIKFHLPSNFNGTKTSLFLVEAISSHFARILAVAQTDIVLLID